MSNGSENSIIAYFDGELSDADSAELLHRVSVSPEIRDLFREHEMLRELAHTATTSAVIRPEIESSLFSRIEALAENPVKKKALLVFSRRTAVLAALALVLISGSLGYVVPKLLSGSSQTALTTLPKAENISFPAVSSSPDVISGAKSLTRSNRTYKPYKPYKSNMTNVNLTETQNQNTPPILQTISDKPTSLSEIYSVNLLSDNINSEIGRERHSPFDRKEPPSESRSLFEASLQTSSGFTYPADAAPIKPFADQRLSIAYHITENNLIGFRLGSGLYQQLGNVVRTSDNGTELLTRSIETKRSFSEEFYFSHLEPIFFAGNLLFEFSLGGGFIPNGFTLDAEAGIRIPFSENFMFGASFGLSRVHSNALSSSAILASENSSGKPVMLDGTDIHTTLNGRLHYGIIYRF